MQRRRLTTWKKAVITAAVFFATAAVIEASPRPASALQQQR